MIWRVADGEPLVEPMRHKSVVRWAVFSPDGCRLVSGGIDFTARVWDATPQTAEILRAQDTRYERKRKALAEQARAAEDVQIAYNLARSGQWSLAAATFGKFVEQEPDQFSRRRPQILALVEANDIAGARRACEDLLKRSANRSPNTDDVICEVLVVASSRSLPIHPVGRAGLRSADGKIIESDVFVRTNEEGAPGPRSITGRLKDVMPGESVAVRIAW